MNCPLYTNAVTVQHEPHKSASLTAIFLPSLLRIIRSSVLEWTFSFTCTLSVYTLRVPLSTATPKLLKYASARIKRKGPVLSQAQFYEDARYFPGNLPPHPTLHCSGTNFVLTLNSVKRKNRT
jgi:hypothetical protein